MKHTRASERRSYRHVRGTRGLSVRRELVKCRPLDLCLAQLRRTAGHQPGTAVGEIQDSLVMWPDFVVMIEIHADVRCDDDLFYCTHDVL